MYGALTAGQPIVEGVDLASDGTKLYTTDAVQGQVHSMNPDGGAITFLGSRFGFGSEHLSTITERAGMLYVADSGSQPDVLPPEVLSIANTGGPFLTLHSGAPFVELIDIAVDDHDTVYVAAAARTRSGACRPPVEHLWQWRPACRSCRSPD